METSKKRRKNYVVEDEDEEFGNNVISEKEQKAEEHEDVNEEEDVEGAENDEKNPGEDDIEKEEEPGSETKELSDSQESVHDKHDKDVVGTEENGLEEDTEDNETDVQPNPEELPVTSSQDEEIDEAAIKAALMKRAHELKSRAETLTLTIVRQTLAKDLGLELDGLDMHKKFIRGLVDELLQDAEEEPVVNAATEKKPVKKDATSKREGKPSKPKSSTGKRRVEAQRKVPVEERSEKNDSVSENTSQDEEPVTERKKQKRVTEGKAKIVAVKKSVDEKRPFSAKVERLRDILKNVGIGVSPAIYRKAKHAPEHEREELLVRELQQRLVQEGLSPNPTEKEIRRVKAKLQKAKDLDGIDNSNIVVEPRRRAAANDWFAARPNKYLQAKNADKAAEEKDSDDELKPVVTGAMDEVMDD